jgi:hypothetical protein
MTSVPVRSTGEDAARETPERAQPAGGEGQRSQVAAPPSRLGAPPPIDPRYATQAQPLLARQLLAMQATAGNAATRRLARQPAGGGITTSQADAIARQLEDAMSGLGTDEEAIYGALSGRTGNDMSAIRRSYQRLFDEDLDAELEDELSGDELARVQQMMAPVADETTQSAADQQRAAGERTGVIVEQLVEAMAGLGTEEDQIFNALTGRSPAEILEIRTQYRTRTGSALDKDLRDEMSGGELRQALTLLGVASSGEFTNRVTQNMTEGKTTVVRGRFDYTLTRERLEIDVPVSFQPAEGVTAPISTWQSQIQGVWGQFAVVEPAGRKLPIDMKLIDNPGDSRVIRVVQNSTPGSYGGDDRANAGKWYPVMPPSTAPHEFGHLIGLPDEYQRTREDFEEITGETRTGPENTSGKTNEEIADELHDALSLDTPAARAPAATTALQGCGLIAGGTPQQGDFAQAVRTAYDDAYGDLLEDLQALPRAGRWTLLTVFSYASGTTMGNPQSVGTQSHEHPVMPRHMREFVRIVQAAWPDFAWEIGPK